jgi:hypothetical protein
VILRILPTNLGVGYPHMPTLDDVELVALPPLANYVLPVGEVLVAFIQDRGENGGGMGRSG